MDRENIVIRAFPLVENHREAMADELNLRYQQQRIDCSTSIALFRRFFTPDILYIVDYKC